MDGVSVAVRVAQAFQNDDRATVAKDAAGRLHGTRKGQIALAAEQAPARHPDRSGRTGTSGWHIDARTLQMQSTRDQPAGRVPGFVDLADSGKHADTNAASIAAIACVFQRGERAFREAVVRRSCRIILRHTLKLTGCTDDGDRLATFNGRFGTGGARQSMG